MIICDEMSVRPPKSGNGEKDELMDVPLEVRLMVTVAPSPHIQLPRNAAILVSSPDSHVIRVGSSVRVRYTPPTTELRHCGDRRKGPGTDSPFREDVAKSNFCELLSQTGKF